MMASARGGAARARAHARLSGAPSARAHAHARAPGVSLHVTTTLFGSLSAHALAASIVCSLVCRVPITSTSRISCTGLKKCTPTNWQGRPDASACAVTGSEEVFDAKIASGLHSAPSCAQNGTLIAMSSTIASITRSASDTAAMSVANERLPRMRAASASAAGWSRAPFDTCFDSSLLTLCSMRARPASSALCSRSTPVTRMPALAAACAMPWPIRPRPTTPTDSIGVGAAALAKARDRTHPRPSASAARRKTKAAILDFYERPAAGGRERLQDCPES